MTAKTQSSKPTRRSERLKTKKLAGKEEAVQSSKVKAAALKAKARTDLVSANTEATVTGTSILDLVVDPTKPEVDETVVWIDLKTVPGFSKRLHLPSGAIFPSQVPERGCLAPFQLLTLAGKPTLASYPSIARGNSTYLLHHNERFGHVFCETLGTTHSGYDVKLSTYPPSLVMIGQFSAWKPSRLDDKTIENETILYNHFRSCDGLDIVPVMLFSGFSTTTSPRLAKRSKNKVELCRMLITTYSGKPRTTRWTAAAQKAVCDAYEKLWAAGVLHVAVADRNVLFHDRFSDEEESTEAKLCDFEQAVLKKDLDETEWNIGLGRERKALMDMCDKMSTMPEREKPVKRFWTAEEIREINETGNFPPEWVSGSESDSS